MTMRMAGLDHLVLTVADLERSIAFYQQVLGMTPETFGDGRRALRFGNQKINLHPAAGEILPRAARPTPGSADLCFLIEGSIAAAQAHLAACGVEVEEGPVPRTGARGPITSLYIRDPDGNLIELSSYN
jgi:catechol 2,3-dioxygenase-like lactoylglutathione lyase family enzyme